jgi:thymidine phosphorylase
MALPQLTVDDPVGFQRLVAMAKAGDLSDEEIARLARTLATSGVVLRDAVDSKFADLASTGGPGSLSTLLGPLYLVGAGKQVLKLGVPGRPAGGIDSLSIIPGYRYSFSPAEADKILLTAGYCHVLAGTDFAPLDAALFQFRRQVGAVAIPSLAVASLLAKKLAFGVGLVGLDVRVFPGGNFGDTRAEAVRASKLFVRVAALLGIEAVCFVHSGPSSIQPWIGRGESLSAMHQVLVGAEDHWLGAHASLIHLMVKELTGRTGALVDARSVLSSHLIAQGTSWSHFEQVACEVSDSIRGPIPAVGDGFWRGDLNAVRAALLDLRGKPHEPPFRDVAGLRLAIGPGARVRAGEPIGWLRDNTDSRVALEHLSMLVGQVQPEPVEAEDYMETIRA